MAHLGTTRVRVEPVGSALEPLLTVRGLCAALNVSKQTVYRLIHDGELVPIRVRNRPRFDPDEVRAYLKRHREEGGDATTATTYSSRTP